MNFSARQQLVRESSGSIADQNHTISQSKMSSHAKLVSIAIFFCLGLIALTHCIPVEVIYTGEGCDCPTKLDFTVNVPSVPKAKKYRPSEYGYKIEVPKPRETKAKVSYSFDFEVEEPRPPKPVKPAKKTNLYAMIDRVAIKKGDCEDGYAAPPSTCSCGQCAAVSAPLYRYVYNQKAPQPLPPTTSKCNCQRQNCKCNLGRIAPTTPYSPNAIFMGNYMLRDYMLQSAEVVPTQTDAKYEESNNEYNNNNGGGGDGDGDGDNETLDTLNIRRKRDLQSAFLRPRKLSQRRRPSRFVKLYRKNLAEAPATPQRLFDLESLISKQKRHQQQQHNLMRKMKRKVKKTPYALQRPRLMKREIKGEYDLLEKEREQLDLTLPEIIQFMPETLQPDFKRGQCYYGCGSATQKPANALESTEHTPSDSDNNPTSNESNIINSKESAHNKPNSAFITYIDAQTETATDLQNTLDENGNTKDDNTTITNNHDTDTTNESLHMDTKTDIDKADAQQKTTNNNKETKISSSSTFTKRHAKNYHETTCTKCSARTKKSSSTTFKSKKSAYNAQPIAAPPISINPNYKTQQNAKNAPSATSPTTQTLAKIPACEMKRKWHLETNKQNVNTALTSTARIRRESHDDKQHDDHSIPMRYASELDASQPIIRPHDFVTPLHDHKYSIQFIDVKHLDKIIADIVHSHPEFLYATAHLGGALVDPESWQEQEAVNYAKHLVDDRLSLLFGKENDFSIQQHIPSVPIPLYGLLPPLF